MGKIFINQKHLVAILSTRKHIYFICFIIKDNYTFTICDVDVFV